MQTYLSVLPPPFPPVPARVWVDGSPRVKCISCGEVFDVEPGLVKCPKCGTQYLVASWDWQSFLIGLAVGLLIGFVISAAVYYFVFRPYMPLAEALTALAAPPRGEKK